MDRMHIGLCAAALATALVLVTPPAVAQDVYENAVPNHGRVVLDNAILRHNLKHARNRQNARRGADGADARKAAACANRARFKRQYGANHPKVRQLYALCARAGY